MKSGQCTIQIEAPQWSGETNEGARVTGIEHENDTAEDGLSNRQVDAARLIATNPDRPKQDIAASLGISRRTVFRWLENEKFVDKVNQFRRSPVLRSDPGAILETLGAREKKELFELLKKEQEPHRLPEIKVIERKIMDIAKNDHTVNRLPTKKAVTEVALLLGRLNANALCFVRYNPDGTHHYKDRLDKISWYLQDEAIRANLFGSKALSIAISKALSLIEKTMQDVDEPPDPGRGFDRYDELGDQAYDDALDEYWPDCEQGEED